MIPHHHDCDLDEFSSFHAHGEQSAFHKTDHHHDADHEDHNNSNDTKKEKRRSFPFHHHISPTNDYDYLRIKLNTKITVNVTLLLVLNSYSDTSLYKSPELDFSRFTDKPFHISSIFEPGATGLRAPPSVA
jgi:hypothetical protein